MYKSKHISLLILIITLTFSLVFLSYWAKEIILFKNLPKKINSQIFYQTTSVFGTIIFLFILRYTKKNTFKEYFQKGNVSAEILPEPRIGIKPKAKENWFHLGINFSVIISGVTSIVIYFQLIKGAEISIGDVLNIMPYSIVFALSNSFVEESITRLGVVVVFKNILKDRTIPFISAIVFGTVHYWGNPGGLLGIIVAGFLGWFLTKSILETKGIFWAWFIHFLQDVIILSALLSI